MKLVFYEIKEKSLDTRFSESFEYKRLFKLKGHYWIPVEGDTFVFMGCLYRVSTTVTIENNLTEVFVEKAYKVNDIFNVERMNFTTITECNNKIGVMKGTVLTECFFCEADNFTVVSCGKTDYVDNNNCFCNANANDGCTQPCNEVKYSPIFNINISFNNDCDVMSLKKELDSMRNSLNELMNGMKFNANANANAFCEDISENARRKNNKVDKIKKSISSFFKLKK